MSFEIRQAAPEEMAAYRRMTSEAFLSPPMENPGFEIPADYTLCAFENGKMATSYVSLPLKMQFNGCEQLVAGISGVSTSPQFRRQGHLRKITTKHFELLREKGKRPIAILWAAHAAIYQRFGYGIVSTVNTYNVAPRYIQFPLAEPVAGSCRESGEEEFGLIKNLYQQFLQERTGYIHRSDVFWKMGPLAPVSKGKLLKTVVYEEKGIPLGYVIYTVRNHPVPKPFEPDQQVRVRDLIWLTPSALQAIWDVFSLQDLARTILWLRAPSDDPLPHLLLEPRMLKRTSWDGLLGRIIDVAQGLTGRRYAEEGKLTFEIIDGLCPWNQGCWCLEASPSGSRIQSSKGSPGLVMPVSTLAMLLFGQISASQAALMGRLQVNDARVLPVWDRVMKTAFKAFCPDDF